MPRKNNVVPLEAARKEGKPMAAENKEKEFTKLILKDDNGARYTLEFNARVVKRMQRNGFKVDSDAPNVMIEELLVGAFQMNHKGMTPERIMAIWDCQRKKDELLAALIKLYMQPLEALMAEPEGDENADPTWETA